MLLTLLVESRQVGFFFGFSFLLVGALEISYPEPGAMEQRALFFTRLCRNLGRALVHKALWLRVWMNVGLGLKAPGAFWFRGLGLRGFLV